MAQQRYWDYQDDDYTLHMNWRDFPYRPHGRYAGFDLISKTGLNLVLGPVGTAKSRVALDLSVTPISVFTNRQGVTISEDANISFPITANDTGFDRIDLIIISQQYIESVGGEQGLYSVVQGTPAADPVAPALPNTEKDVILGTLYVPASSSDLSTATYTPAKVPDFAGDLSVAHKDRNQEYKAYQQFLSSYSGFDDVNQASYRRDTKVLSLPTYAAEDGLLYVRNAYRVFEDPATATTGYGTVESVSHDGETIPDGFVIDLYCLSATLFTGSNFDKEYYAFEEWITLRKVGLVWHIDSGRVTTARNNKYRWMQIFNDTDAYLLSNQLTVNDNNYKGNVWNLDIAGETNTEVRFIKVKNWANDPNNDKANYAGSFVVVNIQESSAGAIILKHNASGANDSQKPLWLPGEADIQIDSKTSFLCVETSENWKVMGLGRRSNAEIVSAVNTSSIYNDGWKNISMVAGYTAVADRTPAYRKTGQTLHLRGQISIDSSVYWTPLGASEGESTITNAALGSSYGPSVDAYIPITIWDSNHPTGTTGITAVLKISTTGALALIAVGGFTGTKLLYLDGINLNIG